MGNWWWKRERVTLEGDRDKKKERELLQTIFTFDFNNIDHEGITVEETLMLSITNDLGEIITPQVTNILFSEFKKFIFLNVVNQIYTKESKGGV